MNPAYVHNYLKFKNCNIDPMVKYCTAKNIPFCQEEVKFYHVKSQKEKHKNFIKTVNDVFETGRPDEEELGISFLTSTKTGPKMEYLSD